MYLYCVGCLSLEVHVRTDDSCRRGGRTGLGEGQMGGELQEEFIGHGVPFILAAVCPSCLYTGWRQLSFLSVVYLLTYSHRFRISSALLYFRIG